MVYAAVPQYISFQGNLMEDGTAINGDRTMTFSFWDNDIGGAPSSGLWNETQTVDITDGIYNVELGLVTALPTDLHTNNDLFLQVDIRHPTAGMQRLSPLMPLNSTVFALKAANADMALIAVDADTLDGMDSTELDQSVHVNDIANPHGVSPGQIGAATGSALTSHEANASAHHSKTTSFAELTDQAAEAQIPANIARDSEIMPIVLSSDGPGTGLDADMLDGLHASSFQTASSDFGRAGVASDLYEGSLTLASKYVNVTGDTIAGSDFDALLTIANSGFGHGIEITDAGDDGINISNVSANGLEIQNPGQNGISIFSPNFDGIYIGSPQDDGVHIYNTINHGVHVENTGLFGDGVRVVDVGDDGVHVESAASDGVYVQSALVNGVNVESAGLDGVSVLFAGQDGVSVNSAGNDGVYVGSAVDHGIHVFSADKDGIYVESAGVWAGHFIGNVGLTGTLYKGGGAFRIDHPLEPENKYLSHSFVESPDMMNVYNGNIVLDANGESQVELPEWFEALNNDFRYQLTPIGASGPNLYIAEEISENRFRIAGGRPGLKVSWQVTGIRQDPYASANRIVVEEEKPHEEKGYYLHPEAYDQPEEKNMKWAEYGGMDQRLKELKAVQEKREQERERHEFRPKARIK